MKKNRVPKFPDMADKRLAEAIINMDEVQAAINRALINLDPIAGSWAMRNRLNALYVRIGNIRSSMSEKRGQVELE